MVRTAGFSEFKKSIASMKTSAVKNAETLEDKTLNVGLTVAKSKAPVDTGELRDSIKVGEGGLTVNAEHGASVEYGTFKQQAQPYFRPAVEAMSKYVEENVGGVLDDTK